MHAQIRLAERQGLLQGRSVSVTQSHALLLLQLVEDAEREKALTRSLKQTVGELGWDKFVELFPEYLPTPGTDEVSLDEALSEDEFGNTGAVTYDFSESEALSPEEGERLLAQLMAEASSGSVNGSQTAGEWM